ncbi:MoaD/ThiS family protein [Flavobacterium nackdongense]|uniref:MoaD/ThiS family protein n=1 Tax=Flavobacterium nackdongense TaxID=2547394 RepID=A0A4P6YB69_9FLAO|nr:MoaD/ThiS family protein [Flavobacterium nackdongense]QBN18014.1 MoaD/ThiS family protein [Flavobacterium nackdongense]
MEINLLAFGQIAEITGKSTWKISEVEDTNALIQKLEEEFPALVKMKYSIAVNKKVVQTNTIISDKDTIALLPPFSGG